MNSPLPPHFFCRYHGYQGYRTVCKWCDQSILPPRASEALPRPSPGSSTGGAFFFSADPQQVSGQVVANQAHEKILRDFGPETA